MFDSQPTPYDISFRILGYPVRVHPFFWLIALLFGMRREIGDLSIWIVEMASWVVAMFVSILVHELGHAVVYRHVYRTSSSITIHGLGGVTVPMGIPREKRGYYGLLCNVFLSAAGPLAGFALAFLCHLIMTFLLGSLMGTSGPLSAGVLLWDLCNSIMIISIIWGVFNLLPIQPMDGGQIMRKIFVFFSPRRGVANSLGLSIFTGVVVAVLAFNVGLIFMTFLIAFMVMQNFQELSSRSFRGR